MSVRCEGDCKVMEQLGERQHFESELSRLGFSHEAFTIVIRLHKREKVVRLGLRTIRCVYQPHH